MPPMSDSTSMSCCQCDCASCGIGNDGDQPLARSTANVRTVYVCSFHACSFQSELLAEVTSHKRRASHGCFEGERCGVFSLKRSLHEAPPAHSPAKRRKNEEEAEEEDWPGIQAVYKAVYGIKECSVALERICLPEKDLSETHPEKDESEGSFCDPVELKGEVDLEGKLPITKEDSEHIETGPGSKRASSLPYSFASAFDLEEPFDNGEQEHCLGDDQDVEWLVNEAVENSSSDAGVKSEEEELQEPMKTKGGKRRRVRKSRRKVRQEGWEGAVGKYSCPFLGCGVRTKTPKDMQEHNLLRHFSHSVYDYGKNAAYDTYLEKVEGARSYACKICRKICAIKIQGQMHLAKLHFSQVKDAPVVRCLYCTFEAPHTKILKKHVKAEHFYIRSHEAVGLSSSEVPAAPGGDHKCRTCGFSAINAKALSLHEGGRHQEDKGGEENKKEAEEGSTVKPQKPTTQRSPAEMKTCPFIGCDFKGMRLFNHQNDVHFGHPVYGSETDAHLHQHLEVVSRDGGRHRRHKCKLCLREFETALHGELHIVGAHPVNARESSPSLIKCLYCNFTTSHTRYLKKHVMKHHLERFDHKFDPKSILKCDEEGVKEQSAISDKEKSEPSNVMKCRFLGCNFEAEHGSNKVLADHQAEIHFSHKVYDSTKEDNATNYVVSQQKDGALWHRCNFCSKEFMSRRSCREHITTKHLGGQLRCLYCPAQSGYTAQLKRHVMLFHPYVFSHESVGLTAEEHPFDRLGAQAYTHQCRHCRHRAINQKALDLHEEFHSSSSSLGRGKSQAARVQPKRETRLCTVCGWTTTAKERNALSIHMERMHGEYVCDECGFETPLRAMYKRHMRNHGKICPSCNYPYCRGERAGHHECCAVLGPGPPPGAELLPKFNSSTRCNPMVRRLPDDRGAVCVLCGFTSKRTENARRHVLRMHAEHKCHLCHFSTTDRPNLLKHLKFNHKLRCTTCGFVGQSSEQALNHRCSKEERAAPVPTDFPHGGGVAICPHCGYIPTREEVLPKHIRMVHGNIGDRKTVGCDECDAQLSSKGSLRLHKVTQHGFDDGRGDVHTCEVCNYKTLQAHRMRKHRLTHQERRFECGAEGCFFSAGSANGLTAHMKMHGPQAAN